MRDGNRISQQKVAQIVQQILSVFTYYYGVGGMGYDLTPKRIYLQTSNPDDIFIKFVNLNLEDLIARTLVIPPDREPIIV
jgi:hypothetical protein